MEGLLHDRGPVSGHAGGDEGVQCHQMKIKGTQAEIAVWGQCHSREGRKEWAGSVVSSLDSSLS